MMDGTIGYHVCLERHIIDMKTAEMHLPYFLPQIKDKV